MIGKTISHYKILEKLRQKDGGQVGEWDMGVVYKAEHLKLKRTVALKFLPPELIHDPEAKECFIHEAQTASALDLPNDGETLKKKVASGQLSVVPQDISRVFLDIISTGAAYESHGRR